MLSAFLNNDKAIQVSIKIIDAFIEMRHFLQENASIFQKFQQIDEKILTHDNH